MSRACRVLSLVVSALMALATGLVTQAIGPATATAAPGTTYLTAPTLTPSVVLPDVTVHSSTAPMTNLTTHTGVTRTASCASGSLVGGGGYLRNAANPATLPTNGLVLGGTNPSTGASPVDHPVIDGALDPSNWMAIANFTGVAESGDQAAAFALCANNGPTHTVVKSTTTTGANAMQQANLPTLTIATCPTGTTLIGGGAFTNTPDQINDGTTVGNNGNLKPLASYPSNSSGVPAADGSSSATSWSAYGSAGITSTTDTVTSLALCTSDPISPVTVARVDLSGPDAQPNTTITTATAACPTGTRMLGGGFKTDETVNGISGLQPQQGYHMRGSYPSTGAATPPTEVADTSTNPSAWTALLQAGGQNLPTGNSMQLHTFAMCFNLPQPTPSLNGGGAQTTQGVMNALSAVVMIAGNRVITSWDVIGGPVTTKPTPACTNIARPATSLAGIVALVNDRAAGTHCWSFARSSIDDHTGHIGDHLTYIPFATDAVGYAIRGPGGSPTGSSINRNLSVASLKTIYTQTGTTCLANFRPLLPQFGSGTRKFFLENILGLGAGADVANYAGSGGLHPCLSDTDGAGNPLLENTGNLLTDDRQILPYSVASWIAQTTKNVPDVHGVTLLGNITGTPSMMINTAVPGTRAVFNVVPNVLTAPGTNSNAVFVGPTSQVCQNTTTIRQQGLATNPNCGNTTIQSDPNPGTDTVSPGE